MRRRRRIWATLARCRNQHRKVNYARPVPRLLGVPICLFAPRRHCSAFVLLVPYAAAAENEDIAVLRRMLGELKAENCKLFRTSQRPGGTSPCAA